MNKYVFAFLFFASSCFACAQIETNKKLTLSLPQVIEMARTQSPASKMAKNEYENRYWQYRTFKSNYKPQLRLSGTLPELNRSISTVTQNDGRDLFVRRSLANSSLDLSLSQNIAATGSEVFMSSQLQRIDVFDPTSSISYLANPAVVGIRQPLFMFNQLRWDNKIEPLRFEEAKRKLNEDMEAVSIQANELFFNLYNAQISLKIQEQNVSNTDTLYKISVGRYNLGKIAENDLLQLELNVMNAQNNFAQATLDYQLASMRLTNFLKLPDNTEFDLIPPSLIPDFKVDLNTAISYAQKNRQAVIEFERQRLEAQRNVQKAKGDNRLNANLFASYGLTQSAPIVEDVYANPQDQQRVRVGFEIPILDWGRTKSQIKTSAANKEMIETSIEQAEQSFLQEIILLVKQFEMYKQKLLISEKADTIAQKRFDIAMNRYLIGKISILDLNVAMQEKDMARLEYISSLRNFWYTYFEIRRKTLYDFEHQTDLYPTK
jgi:outer membrane protein